MDTSMKVGCTSFALLVTAVLFLAAAPDCSSAQQVRDHRPCCTESKTTGCKECFYKPRRPGSHTAPGGVSGGNQVKPPPR
jgi:hypothetical protein